MKLTKIEAKKLAKTAKSIISEETIGLYEGGSYRKETKVTADEMVAELKHCSRWSAEQYGNQIFVSGTVCSFTVNL